MTLEKNELIHKIGRVDIEDFTDYMKTLAYRTDSYKSSFGRRTLPIALELTGNHKDPDAVEAYRDARIEIFLDRILPRWGIALALHYQPGGGILPHRDAAGYGFEAVSVSSTDFVFRIGSEVHQCKAGEIYLFRTKVLHSVDKLEQERFALVAWRANWSKIKVPF
ncbi:hypothetical protein [Okeania sp. SIO2B9]|uniref:hypothetical protein n=1 Tax=Okeania sp. SIO2B9 TaxID=2607782 RepID=UPI00142ACA42|nr:hypothetical protein [Okeania sp. SIO2B9]NES91365.1 hypothetical protein [Okeania sp. SIO2B9]